MAWRVAKGNNFFYHLSSKASQLNYASTNFIFRSFENFNQKWFFSFFYLCTRGLLTNFFPLHILTGFYMSVKLQWMAFCASSLLTSNHFLSEWIIIRINSPVETFFKPRITLRLWNFYNMNLWWWKLTMKSHQTLVRRQTHTKFNFFLYLFKSNCSVFW